METEPFEKLGAFYLGKIQDVTKDVTTQDYVLYDAKDLTTHALCVGMTGSGKTGLCVALLEEAGIDGIPAIVVDPKGDLGNLLLTFPQLRSEDFRPWVDPSEAARGGQTVDQYAERVAARWRDGLSEWGQDGDRIERFRSSVDLTIYTPGSGAGVPLTVLRSFSAPPQAIIDDVDAFRDCVSSSTSGLLALLGVDIDPIRSREFILVSNLLDRAWRGGRDMDLPTLIHEIQKPPFEKIGVMDVDTFYPTKDRLALSMTLNSLLASPSFASWLEGEPLDINRLLYTPSGRPRISILSIAHLSESERMFFVTILLNELLTWVRGQAGTPSLRALFYMDEVFGYFPPVANPPTKKPMLTLLKQARAYGLGLVLATQNPVDLDYKGLSNCGTWFLGRLQTERDKARVLDGLEGASTQTGATFDRQQMDTILSGLGGRVFLMNNVHDDAPVTLHTRWAMSYLRGPLTRDQIRTLMNEQRVVEPQSKPEASPAPVSLPKRRASAVAASPSKDAVTVPPEISQQFLKLSRSVPETHQLVYQPALLGTGRLHFVRSTYHVDHWEQRWLVRPVDDQFSEDVWDEARISRGKPPSVVSSGDSNGEFATLPSAMAAAKSYAAWQKELKSFLYRTQTHHVWKCTELKEYSRRDEDEREFRIRIAQRAREQRDLKVEKLRGRYASKVQSLDDQIRRASEKVDRERSQYQQKSMETAISIGASVFGALFSRKKLSRTNVDRASSSARRAGRVAREREDIARAKEDLGVLLQKRTELDQKIADDVAKIERKYRADHLELQMLTLRPRKSDIAVEPVSLVWAPWIVDPSGEATAAFD